ISKSRIEPKVWLANERTWLNWCRTGLLIGSFGLTLINASPSKGSRLIGLIYCIISIGTITYGWYLYQRRLRLISKKFSGHFDEIFVPIVISSSLFLAISINFIFR
ncbi:hypothetical protein BY996DRAFT_4533953, partial [Phakopsora pachyrhizi]